MSSLRKILADFFRTKNKLRLTITDSTFGINTELCHLKETKKDQNLSEIIDMLRRSKKSSRYFPPWQETSVHPPAWTLTYC